MDCKDYGTYSRLLRVTEQVLRAVRQFKTGVSGISEIATTVTPEELAAAKVLWIASAKQQCVNDKNFQCQQVELRLLHDERGLWRCGGTLSNAEVPFAVKHPMLLPTTHPLPTLIEMEAHRLMFHNGVKKTLAEIRRTFWILKGRSLTRSLLHRCMLCRRFEGAPFKTPPLPPLPSFSVKEDPAFSYTGVDFAGPLSVQAQAMTNCKVWICLYTYFFTRAVH